MHSPKKIPMQVRKTPPKTTLPWPEIPTKPHLPVMAMQSTFQQNEWLPSDTILNNQLSQIQVLIKHALKTVPFYKEAYQNFPINLSQPFSMGDLRKLPIISRNEIQNAGERFVTKSLPPNHGKMFNISTSGSTGRPLQLKGTGLTGLFFSAFGLRYHLWHRRDFSGKNLHFKGMPAGEKIKQFSGWVPGVRSGRSLQVNHTLPSDELLQILLKENPKYIQVFPSTLHELIRLSKQLGKRPTNLAEVRVVSESLNPELRHYCMTEWGVPISNLYSCEEAGTLALQCPENEHLHVQSENCLIEVLDDEDNPCHPGQIGRTVITCLNNYATPLIRYENGDMAEVGEACSCGRGLPVLTKIAGRVRNLVVLPSGQRATPVFGFLDTTLIDLPVLQFQYIQKTINLIKVYLVTKRPMTSDETNRIGEYFNIRMGHDFKFEYIFVNEIKRLPSGKYEEFRCDISS